MICLRFGHASGNSADADFCDELNADARGAVCVLQVVDQLRDIFDRIDVVMRRRRDQADTGGRAGTMPHWYRAWPSSSPPERDRGAVPERDRGVTGGPSEGAGVHSPSDPAGNAHFLQAAAWGCAACAGTVHCLWRSVRIWAALKTALFPEAENINFVNVRVLPWYADPGVETDLWVLSD